MVTIRRSLLVVAVGMMGSGCALNTRLERTVNLDDGYEHPTEIGKDGKPKRKKDLASGPTLILDASKRVVTTSSYDKASWKDNRIKPERIICAEPSPDVAQGVSKAIQAAINLAGSKAGAEASGSASGGYSSAIAIAQLGERLATIQLLRDELSDLCRSYANGAISTTNYTLRLSSLDDKMVTLLMGEMAAGAFGRSLASTGGGAGGGATVADPARVTSLRDRKIAQEGKVAEKKEALKQARDADAKSAESDNVAESESSKEAARQLALEEATLAAIISELEMAESLAAQSFAFARSTQPGEIIGAAPASDPSGAVVELQENYLDKLRIGTITEACITALDRINLSASEERADDEALKKEISELEQKKLAARRDYNFQLKEVRSSKEYEDAQRSVSKSRDKQEQLRAFEALQSLETDVNNLEAELNSIENQLNDARARLYDVQPTYFARLCGGRSLDRANGRPVASDDSFFEYEPRSSKPRASSSDALRRYGILPEITRQLLVQQNLREHTQNETAVKAYDGCLKLISEPEKHQTVAGKRALDACYVKVAGLQQPPMAPAISDSPTLDDELEFEGDE